MRWKPLTGWETTMQFIEALQKWRTLLGHTYFMLCCTGPTNSGFQFQGCIAQCYCKKGGRTEIKDATGKTLSENFVLYLWFCQDSCEIYDVKYVASGVHGNHWSVTWLSFLFLNRPTDLTYKPFPPTQQKFKVYP